MPVVAMASLGFSVTAALVAIGEMSRPVGNVAELLFVLFAAVFVVSVVFGGEPASPPARHAPAHRLSRRSP